MPRKPKAPAEPERPDKRVYGTGTVTQIDEHTWRAQLPRGVDPHRRSRRFPTKREAEGWLADQLERYARGMSLDAGLMTLGEYADDWLDTHQWDEDTERAYRVRRKHLEVIAGVALEDLRPSHVDQVIAGMRRKKNRYGRPLSERFCRLVVGLLSSILMSAVRDGILATNVVERVKLPKLPQLETIVLSETEARQLLNISQGTRWHAVWWIMLATGQRSGEVRGLGLDDVDLDAGRIRVQRSVKTPRRVSATKGRRERWVPIDAPCIAAIRAHLDLIRTGAAIPLRARKKGAPSLVGTRWLFPSHVTGRPYPSNTLWYNLGKALKAAGITRIRPHDLRHSSATFMIARGRPLPVVAEILGHRSSAFTASRYGHVLSGQYRDVAETMSDVLTEPAPKRIRKVRKGGETG